MSSDNQDGPGWIFNPEPLDALRARIGVVLSKCWRNPDGTQLNPEHLFDHASGVRLIVSLEDHRPPVSPLNAIVLHVSLSVLDEEGARVFVRDHRLPTGGPCVESIQKTIREYTEQLLEGSGAEIGELLAFAITDGKGVPHAFFEVDGYTAETLT